MTVEVEIPYSFYGCNLEAYRCRDPEVILSGPADTGKAQPLDAIVWTPYGPKAMGDIQVGDSVLTPDGGTAPVLGVFPQGQREVYRLTFWRDDEVECTAEHLWSLRYMGGGHRNGKRVREMTCVRTTEEIARDYLVGKARPRSKYWVPQADPLSFEERPVWLDAYVLGLLLGDGHLRQSDVFISTQDESTLAEIARRLGSNYKIVHRGAYDYRINANGFRPAKREGELWGELGRLGLLGSRSHNKFVPDAYKYNATPVRLDVLRGLMDSDGTVDKQSGGMPTFSTASQQLALDVKFLVESLGGAATITPRKTMGNYPSHRVRLRYNDNKNLFLLERKKKEAVNRTKYLVKRTLTAIEPAGVKECQCILVGHPDGLYLTDHCIVTHNTLAILTKLHHCALKYPGASIVILRKRQIDTFSTVLQTFIHKVLNGTGAVSAYGGEKAQWFDYPRGSRIWVTGMDKAGKLLSGAFDIAYPNQVEEFSLPDWEILTTRTTGRAGNMPYSQTIGDCNPGPPSHWIRSRAREGKLTFFESTHRDNPELYDPETGELTEGGKRRLDALKRLSGSRLLRLFHGLWAAPEGAIYSVFDEAKHKVESFPIPPLWPKFVGIDPMGAYIAAVWVALDPVNKVLNVYREYIEPFGIPTRQHVENILRLSGYAPDGKPLANAETIFYWCGGGPSERQARLDFQGAGLPLQRPGVGDVWAGIDRINELLNDFALVIHDNCPNLLSEAGDYRRKLKDGIPTDTIDNKEIYHGLDALRYGCAGPEEAGAQEEIVTLPWQRIGPY